MAKCKNIYDDPAPITRKTRGYRFSAPKPMASQYGQMFRQETVNAVVQQKPEPLYYDIPLHIPNIPKGKTVRADFHPPWGAAMGMSTMEVDSFVFIGSRDLWLVEGNINGLGFVGTAMPLDTYRPGCPHHVSWGTVEPGRTVYLGIENRSKARNGGNAEFVGRLVFKGYPNRY